MDGSKLDDVWASSRKQTIDRLGVIRSLFHAVVYDDCLALMSISYGRDRNEYWSVTQVLACGSWYDLVFMAQASIIYKEVARGGFRKAVSNHQMHVCNV